jgi:hypothetical protein
LPMPAKSSQCLEVCQRSPRVGRRASIVCWQTRICKPGAHPSWIGLSGCPGQCVFRLLRAADKDGDTEPWKAAVPNPSPGCYGLQIAGAVAGLVWGLTRSADKVNGLWTLLETLMKPNRPIPASVSFACQGGWGYSPQNLLEPSSTGGCKRRTPCNSLGQMSSGGCGSSGSV